MNEIKAVRLKMKSELPSKKELYECNFDDSFWALVDVVGIGNAVYFALDLIESALNSIMEKDEAH